eukprot:s1586_g6.t1
MERPEVKCKRVADRFARMCLRLAARNRWHFGGLLLWLLQRPWLRFVPLPYGNTRTGEAWKAQAENMVKRGAYPRRHYRQAIMKGCFEDPELLRGAAYLRDRLGIRLSFLEDPMLDGMMAMKASKGARAAIQGEIMTKLKAEAEQKRAKSRRPELFWGPAEAFHL